MKKILKWILGIIVVLAVVTLLVAVPIVIRRYLPAANFAANTQPQGGQYVRPMMPGNGWMHPEMPNGHFGFNDRRGQQRGLNRGFGFNGRFSPFGFGLMFFGGLLRLIPLALLALLLYGVYQLGKRSGRQTLPAPARVSTPSEAPVAAENNNPETPAP